MAHTRLRGGRRRSWEAKLPAPCSRKVASSSPMGAAAACPWPAAASSGKSRISWLLPLLVVLLLDFPATGAGRSRPWAKQRATAPGAAAGSAAAAYSAIAAEAIASLTSACPCSATSSASPAATTASWAAAAAAGWICCSMCLPKVASRKYSAETAGEASRHPLSQRGKRRRQGGCKAGQH